MYVAWYGWLDKVIPGTTTSKIVKKIVVDQLIAGTTATCLFFIGKEAQATCLLVLSLLTASPLSSFGMFHVVMSILEKKDDIFAECKEKAPVAYLVSGTVTPPHPAITHDYWITVNDGIYAVPLLPTRLAIETASQSYSPFTCLLVRTRCVDSGQNLV